MWEDYYNGSDYVRERMKELYGEPKQIENMAR